jgi:hypothetical protein
MYNSHNTIFEFEDTAKFNKKILEMIYGELDKIFEENKDN